MIRVDEQCKQDLEDLLDTIDPLFPASVLFLNVANDLINLEEQEQITPVSHFYCRLFRFELSAQPSQRDFTKIMQASLMETAADLVAQGKAPCVVVTTHF